MRILILEDDENRVKKFKQNFIGCELYITHLPKQAIKWIQELEFDTIFLDHDLAEEMQGLDNNFDVGTGLEVAKYLGENSNLNKFAQIIIHSLNWSGRERMRKVCEKRNPTVIPFTILFEKLIMQV